MKRYAIGDIHGCHKTLVALLDTLKLTKEDELYILGDMIDRGPDSKAVLDHVLGMIEDGYKVTALMGNHEYMFSQAIDETIPYCWDWRRYQNWIKNGGITTMHNFGYTRIDDLKQLDKKYITFINELKPFVELENCFLVHAGFNFKEEDIFKDTNSMYWIRNWYEAIDAEKVKGKLIIHGHTTRRFDTLEEEIKDKKFNAISIDTGCVYNMNVNIGHLCAIDIDTLAVTFQKNVDKVEQIENSPII